MEPNQAAEHLQTIRTLMERSAVYRRALAPVMIYCGVVGIIAGIAGNLLRFDSSIQFILFWSVVAVIALTGSFSHVRRQALQDSEPFWSPPTRRVLGALIPSFAIGAFSGFIFIFAYAETNQACVIIGPIWCALYGLGIHSAGFFMPRGLKLFGWIFIAIGCSWFLYLGFASPLFTYSTPNWLMGGIFGGLHLAYGIYLYFTEKRGNES